MKPINDIKEAQKAIQSHVGAVRHFELPISDELQDPAGINMAIITDGILVKGWEPNGFVQINGYRIYRYKETG